MEWGAAMSCPWTDRVLDGELLGQIDATAQSHLYDCSNCQKALEEFDNFSHALGSQSAPLGFVEKVMEQVAQVGPLTALSPSHEQGPRSQTPSSRLRSHHNRFQTAAVVLTVSIAIAALFFLLSSDKKNQPPGPEKAKAQTLPTFEIQIPNHLRVGDEALTELSLLWPGPGSLECRLTVNKSPLILARIYSDRFTLQPGEKVKRAFVIEAIKAGQGTLTLEVQSRPGTAKLVKSIVISSLGSEMNLASHAVLGAEDQTGKGKRSSQVDSFLKVHSLTGRLRGPRTISLQLLPGPLAEVELALRHLLQRPHSSFETIVASMDLQLIGLETNKSTKNTPVFLQDARSQLKQSLDSFWTFQTQSGTFAPHPNHSGDPWLTAVALDVLVRLRGLALVDDVRVQQLAKALLGLQTSAGAFPGRGLESNDISVTAVALSALLAVDNTTLTQAALTKGVRWLQSRLESPRSARLSIYKLALVARLWLDLSKSDSFLESLITAINRARQKGRRSSSFWLGQRTLTGTRQRVANVEATALVAQVLLRHGHHKEKALGALQWLVGNRHPTRGYEGTRASVEALRALSLAEFILGRVVKGRLRARVGSQELLSVEVGNGAIDHIIEISLSTLANNSKELTSRILDEGLSLNYQGQGWFGARLIVSGVAPGTTADQLLKPAAVPEKGLHVVIEKPVELVANTEQQWTLEVVNRHSHKVNAPMLELALPAGFEIARDRLRGFVGKTISAYEKFEGRHVFYLNSMAVGQRIQFPIYVTAKYEGHFWTGVTRIYPYYQPEEEHILEPLQWTVLDQPRSPSSLSSAITKANKNTKEAKRSLTPIGDLEGALVMAWDAQSLGAMNLDLDRLPYGTSALDQLLTKALFRGLPKLATAKVLKPGLEWEFQLKDGQWSDGRAVTVEDFLDSWSRARQLFCDTTKLPSFMDQRQVELLHEMHVEVISALQLRIQLQRPCEDLLERLNCTPFLPGSIWSDPQQASTVLTNGPYRLERADTEEIVLVRRGSKGNSKILLRLLQRRDWAQRSIEDSRPKAGEILERRRADLIWGVPPRGEERIGLGLVGVYLNQKAQHSLDLQIALRIGGDRVKDKRKWAQVSRSEVWRSQVKDLGLFTNYLQLGYDREELAAAADTVAYELREQGFSVTVDDLPYDGFGEPPGILLSSGFRRRDLTEQTSFKAFGRVPSKLGGPLRDMFEGALDRYGYLRFSASELKPDQ
jgi:hypothetical protein